MLPGCIDFTYQIPEDFVGLWAQTLGYPVPMPKGDWEMTLV